VKPEEAFPIKLTIERSVLLKSLARLQAIVEKRNTIPILANVKLEAKDNTLQLTATDMDLVAIEEVSANVEAGGALTVPAQTFHDIVRKIPDGASITLDTDTASAQMIVTAGKAQFKISYLPADDFPVMSEGVLSHRFTMEAKQFTELLEKSRFAMSTEETRYYLNGVYLHVAESKTSGAQMLKAVATDGHRLARIEAALPNGAAGMPGVIIPRKTVNELSKILAEQKNVEVALSESKIRFSAGNVVLLSKLIDGTFPDYQRVIPENNSRILEVDVKVFSNAVDRVSTISTEKTRGIKLSLDAGKVTLTAQSSDAGSAKEELEVTYSSEPMDIGFNSRYLLEMLGQFDGDTVQFLLADSNAPALVTDPTDVSSLYVIMPMRV
jgi:DNA polymerase III subunit beta